MGIPKTNSNGLKEIIYGYSLSQFTWTVDQKTNLVKLKLVWTLSKITPLEPRIGSPVWSLLVAIHMKRWPNVKLGQVAVGSKIAQNHSPGLQEVISSHYLPQFTWQFDNNWNYVKLKSVQTLIKITCLAHNKSYTYIVILCPPIHMQMLNYVTDGLLTAMCDFLWPFIP